MQNGPVKAPGLLSRQEGAAAGGSGPEEKPPQREMTTGERPRLGGARVAWGTRSRPRLPRRHLRDLGDPVVEAAQQEWDELVEEGVAVPQAQQPAPDHAHHCLAHLRVGGSQRPSPAWAPPGPGPARGSGSPAARILGLRTDSQDA